MTKIKKIKTKRMNCKTPTKIRDGFSVFRAGERMKGKK
jgi:hypothetical protein